MDAGLLLFYIVPGLVAFAVDFTNGTIYIPPDGESALDEHLGAEDTEQLLDDGWLALSLEGELNSENVSRTLSKKLGTDVSAAAIELMPIRDNVAMR